MHAIFAIPCYTNSFTCVLGLKQPGYESSLAPIIICVYGSGFVPEQRQMQSLPGVWGRGNANDVIDYKGEDS
jgi:hypothetical protein